MTKTPMTRIECAVINAGLKSFKPALGRCSEICVVGRGRRRDAPPPYLTGLLGKVARNGKKRSKARRSFRNHFSQFFAQADIEVTRGHHQLPMDKNVFFANNF